MTVTLKPAEWAPLRTAHEQRVDNLIAGHLDRRRRREPHPVEDFLFTYYPTRPNQLRSWHPGPGIRLLDAPQYAGRRGYRVQQGVTELDPVYRLGAEEVRHSAWPLRLGADGTDQVVESHRIGCSHFDAFRFFTSEARPLNVLQPTREDQPRLEQGGCLHANMDLYKWATKLMPFAPSSLVLDCFELAKDIRSLDMRASPYDLAGLGYEPVPIETPAGKATYAAAQRAFADRARPLRLQLVEVCDELLANLPRLPAAPASDFGHASPRASPKSWMSRL